MLFAVANSKEHRLKPVLHKSNQTPVFYIEILIHDRTGQNAGHKLERQHALLPEPAQKKLPPLNDFDGGDVAEHFLLAYVPA